MRHSPTPPRWASRFLAWFCRPDLLEAIEGDLEESFAEQVDATSLVRARRRYVREVLSLLRPGIIRHFQPIDHLTTTVAMWKNYAKIAIRQVGRHKLFTGLNILGLATAMSVCLLIIMILKDQYSYDTFHERGDRIYRVIGDFRESGEELRLNYASAPMPLAQAMEETLPWVEVAIPLAKVYRDATYGEKTHQMDGLWADGRMLAAFSFGWTMGDPATALGQPRQIVLTQTAADRLGKDVDWLGKTVSLAGIGEYIVTGIMPDPPLRSHMEFDYLLSLSSLVALEEEDLEPRRLFNWNNGYQGYVYFMAKDGTDPDQIREGLAQIATAQSAINPELDYRFEPQALGDISPGKIQLGNQMGREFPKMMLLILSGLAAMILLLACLNYTNLSIARSLKRAREVGIRKVVGARKGQIIAQFLVESVLISLLSMLLAVSMLEFLILGFFEMNPMIGIYFNLEHSPQVYGMFVLFSVLVGLIAGLLPALQLSRFQPIEVLKKLMNLRLFSYLGLRKTLVVIQFVFSLVFILTTITILQQQHKLLAVDLGLNSDNIVNVDLQDTDYETFSRLASQVAGVGRLSGSEIIPAKGWNIADEFSLAGGEPVSVDYNSVTPGYLENLDLDLVAGQDFTEASDGIRPRSMLLNEQAVKTFGFDSPDEAIGQVLTMQREEPDSNADEYRYLVVGVIRDFHYLTLMSPENQIGPYALICDSDRIRQANIHISSDNLTGTLDNLEVAWKQTGSTRPFRYAFFDEEIASSYLLFSMASQILGFVGFLAIVISCLGLLGMVVYAVEGKTKEIGIRKVLGAGDWNLVWKLSREFVVLLAIAIMIASPAAWLLNEQWLTMYSIRIPMGWNVYVPGLAIVLGLSLLVIVPQTWKASGANPAEVLNEE